MSQINLANMQFAAFVTFLALLELLRQHRVIVYQNAAFHEITILPSREEPDDKPLEHPDDYE